VATKTLKITCPQSIAQTLDVALITIDAYGKTTHFESTMVPQIYDKNGKVVPNDQLTFNQDPIGVFVDVYTVRELPINIKLVEQDMTADSYYILNNYKMQNDTIRVAIDEKTIAHLDVLDIIVSPDSCDENTSSILINLQNHLPDGVYLAKDQDPQMAVELDIVKYQKGKD
jgi:hypothetical protein